MIRARFILPILILAPLFAGLPAQADAQTVSVPAGIPAPSAKPTGPLFTANLSQGSSGTDVMRLQQYLNTHGCSLAQSGPGSYQNETSYFGPLTKAALICFQKDTGVIPATGNLGTLTREYISTLP